MIYYHVFSTAFGYAAILFKREPLPVKRIVLPRASKTELRRRLHDRGAAPAAATGEVLNLCRDIEHYFDGTPVRSSWKLLDLRGFTPLQEEVLKAAASVAHGATRTYGQISAQIGRPGACRFVGTTLHLNSFPVVIPCHRIIRADGSSGGYSGGTELKQRMLTLERGSVRH